MDSLQGAKLILKYLSSLYSSLPPSLTHQGGICTKNPDACMSNSIGCRGEIYHKRLIVESHPLQCESDFSKWEALCVRMSRPQEVDEWIWRLLDKTLLNAYVLACFPPRWEGWIRGFLDKTKQKLSVRIYNNNKVNIINIWQSTKNLELTC